MTTTREVIGVWSWEGASKPRNKKHTRERENFLIRHFEGADRLPHFIWKVEFFKVNQGDPLNGGFEQYYEMKLHRYASNATGSRHTTWVKAYDEHGGAVSTKLVAAVQPETHRLPYRTDNVLPPEWLLLNNPEPGE
jgi:hypothetical protein